MGDMQMAKLIEIDDRFQLLGGVFLLSTRLETMGNSQFYLGELTTKQWYLLIYLLSRFDTPPTVSQLAKEMGTSHQNVKVIANHLQTKGYVRIEKDIHDARVSRIIPTDKCQIYSHERQHLTDGFIEELMGDLKMTDVIRLKDFIYKMVARVDEMMERAPQTEEMPSQEQSQGA